MAVYRGPQCRLCRREGVKLFLKGDRCKSEKCSFERRPLPPGMRVMKKKRTVTEYNNQLREKQKIRRIYGLLEKQFRLYFEKASKIDGITGENMLSLLEKRLDNVVFRSGFALSRNSARQLVLHGHFAVNGKRVSLPSFQISAGDIITVVQKSQNLKVIHLALKTAREIPEWVSIDKVKLASIVTRIPGRSDVSGDIQEQFVVELYSK